MVGVFPHSYDPFFNFLLKFKRGCVAALWHLHVMLLFSKKLYKKMGRLQLDGIGEKKT